MAKFKLTFKKDYSYMGGLKICKGEVLIVDCGSGMDTTYDYIKAAVRKQYGKEAGCIDSQYYTKEKM